MTIDPTTLNELFNFAVDRYRDEALLRFKRNGEWQTLTYGEIARRVRELSLGLFELGIRQGDKLAIWSENRPEWNVADLAVLALGAIDVPIYTTQSRHHVEYILTNSETRAIFVSAAFLGDAMALRERVPSLQYIISFDAISGEGQSATVLSAEALINNGRMVFGGEPRLYESLW